MSCAGYSGAVVTLARFPTLDTAGSIAYIGTLPATCGTAPGYQTVLNCDHAYVDKVLVQFGCTSGVPSASVQFVCSSAVTPSGIVGQSPDGTVNLTCPGDLSPVNVTVTMGNPATFSGGCCFGATAPLGTAVITE